MSLTCRRRTCTTPAGAHTRGYCESDYRRMLRMGRFGWCDTDTADQVRAHLATLRALGWSWQQIGHAACVSSSVPHSLNAGRYRTCLREHATALLAVPARRARSHRGMDVTGARRRVEALRWMGWPMSEVAARVGRPTNSIPTLIGRGSMSAALVADIARVYDELSHLPGPSRGAAAKARATGCLPPAAWDDDTIDDPDAQPATGDVSRGAVDVGEVWHLWRGGMAVWEIARTVGRSEQYVQALVQRHRQDEQVAS